jgi:hypothetical protein
MVSQKGLLTAARLDAAWALWLLAILIVMRLEPRKGLEKVHERGDRLTPKWDTDLEHCWEELWVLLSVQ